MGSPRTQFTEKEIAFLQEVRFPILATIGKNGEPQQTAIWYLLREDGTILLNTAIGRVKDLNVRRDPRVSLCWLSDDNYTYLTVVGRVTEIIEETTQALNDINQITNRYISDAKGRQEYYDMFVNHKRVSWIVTPEKIISAS